MSASLTSTSSRRILTGITASGTPHLGNYIGAIQPALNKQDKGECFYFIADLHSLVKLWDKNLRKKYVLEIAATWLALGLDTQKNYFYRQSDIPEISELTWILMTVASKGLLNRAHAYKSLVAENLSDMPPKDQDYGITMGLFNYPVLMAADILIFNAHEVPVGKDQVQHIEIARDIGLRFNHLYGENSDSQGNKNNKNNQSREIFVLPEPIVDPEGNVLPGLDGRKMSKSYQNTIGLFQDFKTLQKNINKIVTNSQLPGEPTSTEGCTLFQIYSAFSTEQEQAELAQSYQQGIGWGEVKKCLALKIQTALGPAKEIYDELMAHPQKIEQSLQEGAEKTRPIACETLDRVKMACGLK